MVLPILAAGALGWWAMSADSIRSSPDTGLLRDAKAIASFLSEHPDSVVLVDLPSDEPLRFHLNRLDSPASIDRTMPDGVPLDRPVFLVVKESYTERRERAC